MPGGHRIAIKFPISILGGLLKSQINMPSERHCKYESADSQLIVNEGPEWKCFCTQLIVNKGSEWKCFRTQLIVNEFIPTQSGKGLMIKSPIYILGGTIESPINMSGGTGSSTGL